MRTGAYHDQADSVRGPVLGQVNFTAGLPVIRTSPDHGTAYRLAGEDKASAESMLHAIFLACDLFNTRNSNLEIQSEKLHEG